MTVIYRDWRGRRRRRVFADQRGGWTFVARRWWLGLVPEALDDFFGL